LGIASLNETPITICMKYLRSIRPTDQQFPNLVTLSLQPTVPDLAHLFAACGITTASVA
jgi:hypothetical protein